MVVASSAAILLWSIAILRTGALSRGLGIYGSIVGSFGVLGVLSGLDDVQYARLRWIGRAEPGRLVRGWWIATLQFDS